MPRIKKVSNDINTVLYFGIAALMAISLPILAMIATQKTPRPDTLAREVGSRIACQEGYRPALNCPEVNGNKTSLAYCNWDCVPQPPPGEKIEPPIKITGIPGKVVPTTQPIICLDVMCPVDCPVVELPNGCPTCWCSSSRF